jgi:hypothetical protein
MDESNKYFKDHVDKRIREIHERVKNIKAEKVKEKMRKISEIQMKKRERAQRKN